MLSLLEVTYSLIVADGLRFVSQVPHERWIERAKRGSFIFHGIRYLVDVLERVESVRPFDPWVLEARTHKIKIQVRRA